MVHLNISYWATPRSQMPHLQLKFESPVQSLWATDHGISWRFSWCHLWRSLTDEWAQQSAGSAPSWAWAAPHPPVDTNRRSTDYFHQPDLISWRTYGWQRTANKCVFMFVLFYSFTHFSFFSFRAIWCFKPATGWGGRYRLIQASFINNLKKSAIAIYNRYLPSSASIRLIQTTCQQYSYWSFLRKYCFSDVMSMDIGKKQMIK